MNNNNSKQITGMGITALIFGILGLVIFPITCGIIAFIFGLISYKDDGLGIAGIILGIIDILYGLFVISQYI